MNGSNNSSNRKQQQQSKSEHILYHSQQHKTNPAMSKHTIQQHTNIKHNKINNLFLHFFLFKYHRPLSRVQSIWKIKKTQILIYKSKFVNLLTKNRQIKNIKLTFVLHTMLHNHSLFLHLFQVSPLTVKNAVHMKKTKQHKHRSTTTSLYAFD